MPGSVATWAAWTKTWSSISPTSFSEAKMRAGTRIPRRALVGSSYSAGPTRSRSAGALIALLRSRGRPWPLHSSGGPLDGKARTGSSGLPGEKRSTRRGGRSSAQHQLEDLRRLLEVRRLAGDHVGVEERLHDAHERVGHGVRVHREPQGAAPDLLFDQLLIESDRPRLDRPLLGRDDPQGLLRVTLEEGAVRNGGRDVTHAARQRVDHPRGPPAARLAYGALVRGVDERRDHRARELLRVPGPAVGRRPRDPELGGQLLDAQALVREEAPAGQGPQVGLRRDGAQRRNPLPPLLFQRMGRHAEDSPLTWRDVSAKYLTRDR